MTRLFCYNHSPILLLFLTRSLRIFAQPLTQDVYIPAYSECSPRVVLNKRSPCFDVLREIKLHLQSNLRICSLNSDFAPF